MRGRARIAAACALHALLALDARSRDAPTLALRAPVSGATVALVSRVDGAFPFRADASRDRAECLSSPKATPLKALRRVLRTARDDMDAAFLEANRLVVGCMEGRGWRIAFCGGPDQPSCPEGGLALGSAEDGDHE